MELIDKYFPEFTPEQRALCDRLPALYAEWNAKINVISRPDMVNFNERHLLHSLAIAKYVCELSGDGNGFPAGSEVVDVGTGGGLPGVPLAIAFPRVRFTLMDSVGKKILVTRSIIEALGLPNAVAMQARSTDLHDFKADYIVSRAVASLPEFVRQTRHLLRRGTNRPDDDVPFYLPRGIFYLKGGDLRAEVNPFGKRARVRDISDYFDEGYFETKRIVWLR